VASIDGDGAPAEEPALESLAQGEAPCQALLDAASDLIALLKVDGALALANGSLEPLLQAFDRQLLQARESTAGSLADDVAHAFNNRLQVIAGHAELLARSVGGPQRERVEMLRHAVARGAALTGSTTLTDR
jgi:signal transduction histidine kinase